MAVRTLGAIALRTFGAILLVAACFFGTLFLLEYVDPTPISVKEFDIKSLVRPTGVAAPDGVKAIEGSNAPGFLSTTLKVNLAPGNYAAIFGVICDRAANYADLASEGGSNILGKKDFACKSVLEELKIPFQLKQAAPNFEIRVFFGGKGIIQLNYLRLAQYK